MYILVNTVIMGCETMVQRIEKAMGIPAKRAKILTYIKQTVMGATPDEQADFVTDYHQDTDVWESMNEGKKKFTVTNVAIDENGIDFDIDEEYHFSMKITDAHMSRDEMERMIDDLGL